MREVAAIGLGMHPWGKFADKSVTELCRDAVEAALTDAGVQWREIEAVAAASSRFSGGKGWGLNGNDVVEDMGMTGIPVYNLSAGCAAGANAFNIGHTLVASGVHDVVLVVGGEKMPKGFIQTSGVEEQTDPEFLRQRCIGMPGPAFWAVLCRSRMKDHGTTEEQLAKVAVKAHKLGKHNENARFRKEFTLEQVLARTWSATRCACYRDLSGERRRGRGRPVLGRKGEKRSGKPVWVAASAVATARFDDGITRGIGGPVPPAGTIHSEAKRPWRRRCAAPASVPRTSSFVELQDNTVYYELAFPEEWGFCEPGEAEKLLENGRDHADRKAADQSERRLPVLRRGDDRAGAVPDLRARLAAA